MSPVNDRRVLLGLPSVVVFPHDVTTVDVRRPENARALADMDRQGARVLVGALRSADADTRGVDDVLPIGTLARLVSRTRLPGGGMRIVLQGIRRARIEALVDEAGTLRAIPGRVDLPEYGVDAAAEELARMRRNLQFLEELDPKHVGELGALLPLHVGDPQRAADLACSVLPFAYEERAQLLAELDPVARLARVNRSLEEHILDTRAERTLDERLGRRVNQHVLREKLEVLRNELGEPGTPAYEFARFQDKLDAKGLPAAARDAFERELQVLRRCSPESREAGNIRSHLDWALELPWQREPGVNPDVPFEHVEAALTRSHVGLKDVKRRIAEILAIRQLGGHARGTVLCFHGPPGTGKSSMARAVASALGRRFVTIPVGAMMHERELVGTSRRREGASPGAILAGIHRAGEPDPVILLDELDKIALGGEGTAAGALMLLLDPEHNSEFLDQYLGVPFDLSRCLVLATACDVEELPETLLDRMELLPFPGYTESEKYAIAREHLLPRARLQAGIEKRELKVSAGALRSIIRNYTEEAGIRHLNRLIVSLSRKAAVEVVRGADGLTVNKSDLFELLGPRTTEEEIRLRRPLVGVATGLAWTSVGGALLPIEALVMPGSGRMILTGSIGEVMRESVQTAISYVRTNLRSFGFKDDVLDSLDMHLHFPSAATPKDGPSAGIAIVTALVSLLTSRPARHDVALTGEMSLLGAVLPVGGLREKLLAAIRCGIQHVVVPGRNADEVRRMPADVRDRLTIHLLDDVESVLELALLEGGVRGRARTVAGVGPRRIARRARGKDPDVA